MNVIERIYDYRKLYELELGAIMDDLSNSQVKVKSESESNGCY